MFDPQLLQQWILSRYNEITEQEEKLQAQLLISYTDKSKEFQKLILIYDQTVTAFQSSRSRDSFDEWLKRNNKKFEKLPPQNTGSQITIESVLIALVVVALVLALVLSVFALIAIPVLGLFYVGYKINNENKNYLPIPAPTYRSEPEPSPNISPSSYALTLHEINNPGGGDCMYYAFAIALINQIKKEHRRGSQATFLRWKAMNESVVDYLDYQIPSMPFDEDHLLKAILNFDLVARPPNALLGDLQQHLRCVRFAQAMVNLKDTARYHMHAMVNHNEATAMTAWTSNDIFKDFFQLCSPNPIDRSEEHNVFAAIKSPEIANAVKRYRVQNSRIIGANERGEFEKIDQELRVSFFLRLLYGSDIAIKDITEETPFKQNSPIIQAMRLWYETHYWGTLDDLNALSDCFGVNHPIIQGNQMNYVPNVDDIRPSFFIRLLPNHWTTGLTPDDVTQDPSLASLPTFNVYAPRA